MAFISRLPNDASHQIMAMGEPNCIEKSEMEGKRLLEKLSALKGLKLEGEDDESPEEKSPESPEEESPDTFDSEEAALRKKILDLVGDDKRS